MPRNLQYYRPAYDDAANRIMISGNCPAVKGAYLSGELRKASIHGYITVIIDFARTGNFTSILNANGYRRQHMFITELDNYKPSYISVRDTVARIRTHAQRLGYKHSEYATMTAFLTFLQQLEYGERKSSSLQELLEKFRNQEAVEEHLLTLIRNGIMNRREAEAKMQLYLERVESGMTADILLNEIDFIITPQYGADAFSILNVQDGDAVVLCASCDNSTDINDYMMRLWTCDLINLSRCKPLLIVVNSGIHSQIARSYELIETLSHNPNTALFYATDDLFSGADVSKARAFSKMFCFNLYGTHEGDSAKTISSMFGEHWITHYSYTDTQNRRLLSENVLDRLLKTDYSTAVTATLTKESIYPAENIIAMTPREYIIYNTDTHMLQTAFI